MRGIFPPPVNTQNRRKIKNQSRVLHTLTYLRRLANEHLPTYVLHWNGVSSVWNLIMYPAEWEIWSHEVLAIFTWVAKISRHFTDTSYIFKADHILPFEILAGWFISPYCNGTKKSISLNLLSIKITFFFVLFY